MPKIKILQDQFLSKFKSESSNGDILTEMGAASIGSSLQFIKKYEYNFGSGQVVIKKSGVLNASIQFKAA